MPGTLGERRALLGRGPRRWRRTAAAAVLLVQMLERAAFFGVSSNLVLYLTGQGLHWAGGQASRAELVFLGASYLLAPVGGWLADAYLGRHLALALSLLLYVVAAGLLTITASPDGRPSFCGEMAEQPLGPSCPEPGCQRASPSPYCAPTLYCALLLLALAASSVRSTLTSFGADQVTVLGRQANVRFFNWLYWSINVGAVLSLLLVGFIQQNVDFLLGYYITVGCVALAFFIFLFASPIFITKPPTGSQVSSMLKLAFQNCCPRLYRPRLERWGQGALRAGVLLGNLGQEGPRAWRATEGASPDFIPLHPTVSPMPHPALPGVTPDWSPECGTRHPPQDAHLEHGQAAMGVRQQLPDLRWLKY